MYGTLLSLGGEVEAVGSYGNGLCEESPGLRCAITGSSSQFQSVPTDPPKGTAEPISHAGGNSGKTYLKHQRRVKSEENQREKQSREQGKGGSGAGEGTPLQPVERIMLERDICSACHGGLRTVVCPEGTVVVWSPHNRSGESVRRKTEQQTGTVMG